MIEASEGIEGLEGAENGSAEAWFNGFPGGVLVVGRNGLVLSTNGPGRPIADLLHRDAPEALRECINAALEGHSRQTPYFSVPDPEGLAPPRLYDLATLPWFGGAAALLLARPHEDPVSQAPGSVLAADTAQGTESYSETNDAQGDGPDTVWRRQRLLTFLFEVLDQDADSASLPYAGLRAITQVLPAAGGAILHEGRNERALACLASCGRSLPKASRQWILDRLGEAGLMLEADFPGEDGKGFNHVIALRLTDGAGDDADFDDILCLWRPAALGTWEEADKKILFSLVGPLSHFLERFRDVSEDEERDNDALTGFLREQAFNEALRLRYYGNQAQDRGSALLRLRLQIPQAIAADWDRDQKDAVIIAVANLLDRSTRSSDLLGRVGPDEFTCHLADIDDQHVEAKARQIIAQLRGHELLADLVPRGFNVELGIALCDPERLETLEDLQQRTRKAIFLASRDEAAGYAIISETALAG